MFINQRRVFAQMSAQTRRVALVQQIDCPAKWTVGEAFVVR
jgi:hypothetical protein